MPTGPPDLQEPMMPRSRRPRTGSGVSDGAFLFAICNQHNIRTLPAGAGPHPM
jgi:hypothetical protein